MKSTITPAIASAIDRPIHRCVYRPLGGGRRKSLSRRFADILKGRTAIAYDPQDLTTMYQDAAGTLPVYRPGTGLVDPPVGLMLDKGQRMELGPEPANWLPADFNDLTTWTARGTATVGAGGLVSGLKVQAGDGDIYRYATGFQAETYLQARVRMKRVSTVGTVSIAHPYGGSLWGTGRFIIDLSKLSDDWEWIDEFHPAVSGIIQWTSASNGRGGFSIKANDLAGQESLSIYVDSFFQSARREIKGYHAYQTTTTARPTLSGRYNILTAAETLSTQSVTTVATDYTLSLSGAGTVTLSGTATGTYSAGTHTIPCSARTLTLTVSGSVTRADLRVKRDGSSLPAYQSVTNANTYDTAGFPLYLRRDKVDDDLIVQAPAITGVLGRGTPDGAVVGTGIIAAGEYHPLSETIISGLSEITRYVAIDGTLTASEQAVLERYLALTSPGQPTISPAAEAVFSFGLDSVSTFTFILQTKDNYSPVLVDWGDGHMSAHVGAADQTAVHTYATSGTYAVKVYGADESVLTKFSTSAGGMSNALILPSGMTFFVCDGVNTLGGVLSLPGGMTLFFCSGSNTLSGNLSLPGGMIYFYCSGLNNISGYTPSAKASNQRTFALLGNNTLSATDVDNILLDYAAAGGTWTTPKTVIIQGNAANRTSASDAAYASLAAKLATLSVD